MDKEFIAETTAAIVIALIENNELGISRLAETIGETAIALSKLGEDAEPEEIYEPAVNPARSVRGDHIISLIDGKSYKMLKRHLSNHGLTPDEYRERYDLKPDYPMVAPEYSETRSKLAKEIGLGRKPKNSKAAA